MKLKIKAKETVKALSFKDYVIDSATQQINRLKDDIDTFKKMYNKDMSPRETAYLDEAIAEKKKELSNQQALIKKYQKIRSSLEVQVKAAKLVATLSSNVLTDLHLTISTRSYAASGGGYLGEVEIGIGKKDYTPETFYTRNCATEEERDKELAKVVKAIKELLKDNLFNLDTDFGKLMKIYKVEQSDYKK